MNAIEMKSQVKAGKLSIESMIDMLAAQVVSKEIPIGRLFTAIQFNNDWYEGMVALALKGAGMSAHDLSDLGY